ncbi:hypothetical protein COT77_02765 [Candidatus Berkelbacteria bacterium CG10_big_fil_rev_8_21_14_0_10_41_12]|uniref:Uncharacterized protein n=1 Tax=Candidatus Berkelbacteria bacterium CG10_big_fil_rev_8_21_14_0_10_41_12 TaxID=1974513 RepID=A0A2M6WWK0_9BACT|nr:MAG: hypothetical protein COT77_02765 [Candidatus Berkelbacteria bacterium CG10_big_fil_rev_8_21_14_0_10_41_12]
MPTWEILVWVAGGWIFCFGLAILSRKVNNELNKEQFLENEPMKFEWSVRTIALTAPIALIVASVVLAINGEALKAQSDSFGMLDNNHPGV